MKAQAPMAHGGEPILLYAGPPPGSESWDHSPREYYSDIFATEVVTNVVTPALTPFLPETDIATGTAVIVAPGGGFHALSINSEGNDAARWLNARGVAAFVLRYRLVPSGHDAVAELVAKLPQQSTDDMAMVRPLAGADGLASVALVRKRAADFGVCEDRVGFMSFSAGGAVAAIAALQYDETSRPDFVAPIYASLRSLENPVVRTDAPPAFIVAATDDQLGLAKDSIDLYNSWREVGRPVELHIYAAGGHGFGMRTQNLPSDSWIDRFGDWLGAQGLLAAPAGATRGKTHG
jgi:acetyl esterase/lipase